MNKEYILKMNELSQKNKRFALVSITNCIGSSPARVGHNMVICEDGSITGTCGGGLIESKIIDLSIECLKNGKSTSFDFNLIEIGMSCGGSVKGFIQVPQNDNKIVIIGGGHVGKKLYDITRHLQFDVTILDNREDFASKIRFPECNTICCNYTDICNNANIDENTYIIIATSDHKSDLISLEQVITKSPKYIGMIGSKRKIKGIIDTVKKDGITTDMLNKIHAPIGLDIATYEVGEIAISILAEILLIKNNGGLRHLKSF